MKSKLFRALMLASTIVVLIGYFMPFFNVFVTGKEVVNLTKIAELVEYASGGVISKSVSAAVFAVIAVLFVASGAAVALSVKRHYKAAAIPSVINLLILGAMAYIILGEKFFAFGYVTFNMGYYMMVAGGVISAVLPFTPLNEKK